MNRVIIMQICDISNINFKDISVLKQTWSKDSFFSYKTKIRPYFGICYIISGEITYKSEFDTLKAVAGDIVILKKNARYLAEFDRNTTCDILINFQADEDFLPSLGPLVLIKNRPDMQKKFTDILDCYMLSNRHLMVKSILYAIMDSFINPISGNEAFVKIKQLVDDNLKSGFTEKEIAKMCAVSVATLQRIFKKGCGKTLSRYRTEMKLAKAKKLLISGKYSVEAVSEELGFCDSAYFSRCFKKSEGVSPKNYIKSYYTM